MPGFEVGHTTLVQLVATRLLSHLGDNPLGRPVLRPVIVVSRGQLGEIAGLTCTLERQRTVDRTLRSEVGHGAGKGWKVRVRAGLRPLGSRSQCTLAPAYAALAVLRRGGARPCSQEGYARSTAGALHCHWCHGYRECVTRAGSASSQPAVVSVGARHGMGEDIVRS